MIATFHFNYKDFFYFLHAFSISVNMDLWQLQETDPPSIVGFVPNPG